MLVLLLQVSELIQVDSAFRVTDTRNVFATITDSLEALA